MEAVALWVNRKPNKEFDLQITGSQQVLFWYERTIFSLQFFINLIRRKYFRIQASMNTGSDVHSICTRQAIRDDLFLERRHTVQYRIRSVQYSGAKLWNSVPVELRSLKSASQFRVKLKVYFLSQYDKLDD